MEWGIFYYLDLSKEGGMLLPTGGSAPMTA